MRVRRVEPSVSIASFISEIPRHASPGLARGRAYLSGSSGRDASVLRIALSMKSKGVNPAAWISASRAALALLGVPGLRPPVFANPAGRGISTWYPV